MMTKEKKNTKTAPKSSSSKTKPAVKTSVAKASAPVKVVDYYYSF